MNDKKIKELLNFFRRSYGGIYYGDDYYKTRYFHYMTDLIEIKNAKALMVNDRIFSVGTEPNCDRIKTMIKLLKVIKKKYPKSWVSIESKFKSMIFTVTQAGMKRTEDPILINKFLENSDTGEKYLTTKNQNGVVIYRANRKNYFQEIYQ